MDSSTVRTVAIAAGLLAVGYVVYRAQQAGQGLVDGISSGLSSAGRAISDTLSTSLNPASDQNLAYRGANAIGSAVTGDPDFTVGAAVDQTLNGGAGSFWGNYSAWVADKWSPVLDFYGVTDSRNPQASYDETERLRKRYPAPVTEATAQFDALGNYQGHW